MISIHNRASPLTKFQFYFCYLQKRGVLTRNHIAHTAKDARLTLGPRYPGGPGLPFAPTGP